MRENARSDTTEIIFHDEEDQFQKHQTDQEEKSESLFDSLKSDPDSFITVHRQPLGGNNAMEFVGRFDADKFDLGGVLAHIQKTYGGGEYRVKGYSRGKITANKLIGIAHPISIKSDSGESSLMRDVLDRMEKMQQQIVSVMQEKNTGTNSRSEFLQEMMMMKQFFDTGAKSNGGFGEIMTVVSGLKELGVQIGGISEASDTGFAGLAEKFIPLATAILSQPKTSQSEKTLLPSRASPAGRLQAQKPAHPKQPVTIQQPKTEEQKMSLALKMGIATLLNGAKTGADAGDYAELVLANVDEKTLEYMFIDPHAVNKLSAINPEVGKHTQWFIDLGEHIKAHLGLESAFSHLYDEAENDTVHDIEHTDTVLHDNGGND